MTKSRNFQTGRTYHVTHRCHDRDFLLGKAVDRRQYMNLMWRARCEWDVSILSYILTSNHVHLLLSAPEIGELSGFMAHVSGGMARHYNRRKERAGSFWESRYRTTLVQDGVHLSRCLFYIEMNMVRAGVVSHPSKWGWSSFGELSGKRERYRLLDIDTLIRKLGQGGYEEFAPWYRKTLDELSARRKSLKRELWWSEARIVGNEDFVSSLVEGRRRKDIVSSDNNIFYI